MIAAAQAAAIQPLPIVPRPAVVRHLNGTFLLGRSAVIYADGDARPVAQWFAEQLRSEFGIAAERRRGSAAADVRSAFFSMRACLKKATVCGSNRAASPSSGRPAGLFYGAQSVLQLAAARSKSAFVLPAREIQDQPRFPYRGLHLDTSRHMFPVEFLKRYLDWMARYKLNTFHWHLTDDQGWRIEIKKYPRLAEVASMRKETLVGHAPQSTTYDGKPYGGFYTQEQIRDVVAYARERFITVIPEIEMPGHSLAALAAYPELACTRGSVRDRDHLGRVQRRLLSQGEHLSVPGKRADRGHGSVPFALHPHRRRRGSKRTAGRKARMRRP